MTKRTRTDAVAAETAKRPRTIPQSSKLGSMLLSMFINRHDDHSLVRHTHDMIGGEPGKVYPLLQAIANKHDRVVELRLSRATEEYLDLANLFITDKLCDHYITGDQFTTGELRILDLLTQYDCKVDYSRICMKLMEAGKFDKCRTLYARGIRSFYLEPYECQILPSVCTVDGVQFLMECNMLPDRIANWMTKTADVETLQFLAQHGYNCDSDGADVAAFSNRLDVLQYLAEIGVHSSIGDAVVAVTDYLLMNI